MLLLSHYFKFAFRSLERNKAFALTNIFGLVVGIVASMLIGMYVIDEISFDRHFQSYEAIRRVISVNADDDEPYTSAMTTADVAALLSDQFPAFEGATRLLKSDETFLFYNRGALKENIIYTDSAFLRVFKLKLIKGNITKCLELPGSILISESIAAKIFGPNWSSSEVVGESLNIDNKIPLTITGVFKDLPAQTHFSTNLIATVPSQFSGWMSGESNVYTYLMLGNEVSEQHVQDQLQQTEFLSHHEQVKRKYSLQPLSQIHLESSFEDENAKTGDLRIAISLVLICATLLCVCISNFAGFYIAKSLKSSKEVGVRRIVGSSGPQILTQILCEVTLYIAVALILSIAIVTSCIPRFNQLTGKDLEVSMLLSNGMILLTSSICLLIMIVVGAYSSVHLIRLKPVVALRGSGGSNVHSALKLKKGLVTAQLVVAGVMIVLTLVAQSQIKLINNLDLGFDKDNTIAISNPYMLGSLESILGLKQEYQGVTGVEDVSLTGYTPSQNRWSSTQSISSKQDMSLEGTFPAQWLVADEGFINTLGLHLISGRNFNSMTTTLDKQSVIVNETTARMLNTNDAVESAVGSKIFVRDQTIDSVVSYEIVGVVKDFNFGSLHEPIKPMILRKGTHRFELVLRLSKNARSQDVLARLERIWKAQLPVVPFQYTFIKDRFDQLHSSDNAITKIFSVFGFLTICTACFGLISIIAQITNQRLKEIGVRKLLGASDLNIVNMLTLEFGLLFIIAFATAIPISYGLANLWLEDFAYKATIPTGNYVIMVALLGVVGFVALARRTWLAARSNPVENLRRD